MAANIIRSCGCAAIAVGDGSLIVTPPRPYNRQRPTFFDDIRAVEDWTLNGPYLDGISFVSGLKSGGYLIRQSKRADQQVPKFRSDMTPPEIAAMLESLYRVRGGAVEFRTSRCSRGRSSAPMASSSITSISTPTSCGARAGRSERWSTASST